MVILKVLKVEYPSSSPFFLSLFLQYYQVSILASGIEGVTSMVS